jgi:SAM-dependent methyltransferase
MSQAVERQYSNWPYPSPVRDLAAFIANGAREFVDPALHADLLWPEIRIPAPRILVAGCGTNQGAYFAMTNPESEVVGIDISDVSLEHEKYLQAKHGLRNLSLRRLSILDAPSLGKFDFIMSSGVLHHMPIPEAGAAALAECLRPHGTLALALYARAARAGLYILQDAFRLLGLQQTVEDIAFVREVVDRLPENHPGRVVLTSDDYKYDAGLVDLLLHAQDRPYNLREVVALLESSGMALQGFPDNLDYNVEARLTPSLAPIADRLHALPLQDRIDALDLLVPSRAMHRVLACLKSTASQRVLDFAGESLLRYVPAKRPELKQVQSGAVVAIVRSSKTLELTPAQAAVWAMIDGNRTVFDLVDEMQRFTPDRDICIAFARSFLKQMWDAGCLFIRM